eukprot:scaffold145011_cov244-Phaeocystis_antarctica.AAC.1
MPHVAHAPGNGRSVRCSCHVWHPRAPGKGAGRAVCMPHVARAPGGGAGRAACMPRVAHAPG